MLRCTDFVLRYVGFRHFAAYPFLTEIGFEMYFGSVKFFKHLIYTVFLVWLAAATVLAVVIGVLYGAEKKKSADTADTAVHNNVVSEEAEHISLQQHYVNMTADGYTAEDILDFIRENAAASFNSYISALPAESNDAEPAEDTAKPAEGDVMSADNSAEYTKLYPELYANAPDGFTVSDKVIYLTFDDGPSENTVDILSILDKYDIKATFFMCGGDDDRTKEIMKLVADKGHKIGIHSKSHNYTEIYASVESFLADMNDTYTNIYGATGVEPDIIRFPGGSINSYNSLIYKQLIAEVTRRGFVYYDWNASGEDAAENVTWTSIYNSVLNGISENASGRAIVLLHDSAGKEMTVKTVEDIIIALTNSGYTFAPLDNSVKPITFSYTE